MFDFDDLEEDDPSPDLQALAREEAQRAADNLSDPAWDVRRKACKDLAQMGEAARPFLQGLKRLVESDDDFEVMKAARSALKDLRAAGIYLDKKIMNRAREELARDSALDILADDVGAGGSSSSTMQPKEAPMPNSNDAAENVLAGSERYCQDGYNTAQVFADSSRSARQSEAVWTHADVGRSVESNIFYEECAVLEDDHRSSDKEEKTERINYLERKLPMRESMEIRMPGDVSWSGPRINFQINLDVLPMRMERDGMLPVEVVDIWEKQWGIQYTSRIKFCAQPECGNKYLNAREDSLAYDPAIVKLEGAAGTLCSLATALRRYEGLSAHEVQLERDRIAAEMAQRPQKNSTVPRPSNKPETSYSTARDKGGLQFHINMDSRDRQRMAERRLGNEDPSSLVKGPRKKHSFGVYAVPAFKSKD